MATDKRVMQMNAYHNIYECYKSGQITERQWIAHLKDEVFRKWVEKHENNS